MMTLDEAIRRAERAVGFCVVKASRCDPYGPFGSNIVRKFMKCAEEYKQLAKWLKELKQLKEQEPCEDCVSRKAILEMIEQIQDAGGFIGYNTYSEAFDRVNNMSSVTPVACIATVKFNKEDMRELVDEKVKDLKTIAGDRVTCKDCKYNVKNGKNTTMCDIGHRFYMRDHNTFYCADAERR